MTNVDTTVACVYVRGNVPYTVDYVVRLAAMVRRRLARPHRFVCFTDRPAELPVGIETKPIVSVDPRRAWWAKVMLFNPIYRLSGRVLYLDLDTLIVDDLDPIVDFAAPFALIPDAGSFVAPSPFATVKRFNSSVMTWDAGATDAVFLDWSPAVTRRLWGDQDWIGERMPGAATMPLEWFPRLSALKADPPTAPAKVVLVKVPKTHVAAKLYSWVDRTWRVA